MVVAQLFHTYLKTSENWCHRLISNLKDVDLLVVTDTCLNVDKFPLQSARFITPRYSNQITSDTPLLNRILKRFNVLYWFKCQLPRELKKADLFHAHFSFIGWKYLPLSLKLHIPLIVSFYGFDYESLPQKQPEWRERYAVLFSKAALFLVEGPVGKSKLVSMGCLENKVRVVKLGVNVSEIPFILRLKKSRSLRLVQVANFVEKKGHSTTVRAFARVASLLPNMDLTLVGNDPEGIRNELEIYLKLHGIIDRVNFVNGIDFSNLHQYFLKFHVFIHPSRHTKSGDSEGGAPIVILDAQATGMPVLSTYHCDIPEEVAHEVTGILVAENDEEALAEAIEKFYYMEEDDYHIYCCNARKHIEENYDVTRCAEQLLSIYDDILQQRNKL
jgi:colanic acid/amylovoran biosynthesis glycosyltransferase